MSKYPRGSAASRGYDATWRRLRARMLQAEPTCRMCRERGLVRPASVVDHIVKVKDAPHRRLDPSNLACLCASCHNSLKQQQERSGYHNAVGLDGWPTDPNHPANKTRR